MTRIRWIPLVFSAISLVFAFTEDFDNFQLDYSLSIADKDKDCPPWYGSLNDTNDIQKPLLT